MMAKKHIVFLVLTAYSHNPLRDSSRSIRRSTQSHIVPIEGKGELPPPPWGKGWVL